MILGLGCPQRPILCGPQSDIYIYILLLFIGQSSMRAVGCQDPRATCICIICSCSLASHLCMLQVVRMMMMIVGLNVHRPIWSGSQTDTYIAYCSLSSLHMHDEGCQDSQLFLTYQSPYAWCRLWGQPALLDVPITLCMVQVVRIACSS